LVLWNHIKAQPLRKEPNLPLCCLWQFSQQDQSIKVASVAVVKVDILSKNIKKHLHIDIIHVSLVLFI
jgi:hypothetical protein